MHGHYSPNLQWTNEVWGLSMFHTDTDKIATCSDDGTVRVWSISKRIQLTAVRTNYAMDGSILPPDHETGDLQE